MPSEALSGDEAMKIRQAKKLILCGRKGQQAAFVFVSYRTYRTALDRMLAYDGIDELIRRLEERLIVD